MKLDVLRDALLVTLLAMLVYVLYKRLIKLLGREKVQARYVISKENLTLNGTSGTLEFFLSSKSNVRIALHHENGQELRQVADVELKQGLYTFPIDLQSLAKGRYYCQITAPGQTSSRYFNL